MIFYNKFNSKLDNTFLSLGVHIGHPVYDTKTKPIFNYLSVGTRDSFLIFDIKRTSFFLKRAISFLYLMNTKISFNFFYYSLFEDLESDIKQLLLKMVCKKKVLNVCMNLR